MSDMIFFLERSASHSADTSNDEHESLLTLYDSSNSTYHFLEKLMKIKRCDISKLPTI